jgi:hypothetical protein
MGRDARIALVRIGADDRGYRAALRGTEKATQTWAQRVKGKISGAFRDAFSGLGGVVGLAGVAGFAAIARDVKVFNDRLVRLAISSGRTRGEMLQFNQALQATAVATGVSADELLGGAEKYQELTGRFSQFRDALGTFAKVSAATGASVEVLSQAAAALSDNLDVSPDELMRVFDILAAQGKDGAVELRNLAEELAGLTGQYALFGTKGAKGTAQLGAFLQVLRKGAPSAAEAATQMQSIMAEIQNPMNEKQLKRAGVNVRNKDGSLRDIQEIVKDISTHIKPQDLAKIFGRSEARKGLITLLANLDVLKDLEDETSKLGTIERDNATWQESAGAKIAKAQARFKQVFNEALLKNLDAIVSAFESIVKALSWIAGHPEALAGIAALWKGGGFVGEGATAVAGMGGGAGSGRRGGKGTKRQGVNWAGGIGGAMQGTAVGLLVATTLGKDLSGLGQAAVVALHGLAGLPGPFGAVATAAALLADAILLLMNFLTARLEEEQKKIVDQKYGDAESRANADILLGKQRTTSEFNAETGQWEEHRTNVAGGKVTDKDRRMAAQATMKEIFEGGAGTSLLGKVGYDASKIDAVIRKNHPDFTEDDVKREREKADAAVTVMNSVNDLGETANSRADFLASQGLGAPSSPLFTAPEGGMVPYNPTGGLNAPYAGSGEGPYGGPQQVEVILKPAPGFEFLQFITNQIGHRRGNGG